MIKFLHCRFPLFVGYRAETSDKCNEIVLYTVSEFTV